MLKMISIKCFVQCWAGSKLNKYQVHYEHHFCLCYSTNALKGIELSAIKDTKELLRHDSCLQENAI